MAHEHYRIEAEVGAGGMGSVFRAIHLPSGDTVALKTLHGAVDIRRFHREVSALEAIEHDAIVGLVGHGRLDDGQHFLAMQWLEGHDLGTRLDRGPLTVAQTLELGKRICSGLAAIHKQGMIHRDLKPSNIMLVGGQVEAAKLVDFGLARRVEDATALTQTGALLGTVGYMSPEQARGEQLGPASDMFSVGCVLLEALSGALTFTARSPAATLMKIILEEPPTLRQLDGKVPAPLLEVISGLLRKDAGERLADAAHVERLLAAIEPGESAHRLFSMRANSVGELRLLSTLLISPNDAFAETVRSNISSAKLGSWNPPETVDFEAIEATAARFEGDAVRLVSGMVAVRFLERASAIERATLAASCALALGEARGGLRMALVVARLDTTRERQLGSVFDQVSQLLEQAAPGEIMLDASTATMLDKHFILKEHGEGWVLEGARDPAKSTVEVAAGHRLLGRVVPCVGRRKELAYLDGALYELLDDDVQQLVLVSAEAGVGKSRLTREFLQRAPRDVSVYWASTSPLTRDSAGAMGQSLMRAVLGDAPIDFARLEAQAREAGVLDPSVPEFIGEFLGVPRPGEPSLEVRVARDAGGVMAARVNGAFADWFSSLAREHPVLLVLEDVHWADEGSLVMIRELLFTGAPIFVLMLTRPEGTERMESLFHQCQLHRLELSPLSARSARRIIEAAYDSASEALIEELVRKSGGNPFFLEELVRGVAAGRETFPETVLAVVEDRIAQVAPELRRVLRGASVFGERFGAEGVAHVLGERVVDVVRSLEELVVLELLERSSSGRFEDTQEYAFRNALARDAAYGMFPEHERSLAHGEAARWLESVGGSNPGELFEHYLASGEREPTLRWMRTASKAALSKCDAHTLKSLLSRCEPIGIPEEELLDYLFWLGQASTATTNVPTLSMASERLANTAPKGSKYWFYGLSGLVMVSGLLGDLDLLTRTLQRIGDPRDLDLSDLSSDQVSCFLAIISSLIDGRGWRVATPYIEAVEIAELHLDPYDLLGRGWVYACRAVWASHGGEGDFVAPARAAVANFERVGSSLGMITSMVPYVASFAMLGASEAEEHEIEAKIALFKRHGYHLTLGQMIAARAYLYLEKDPGRSLSILDDTTNDAETFARLQARGYAHILFVRALAQVASGQFAEARDSISRIDRSVLITQSLALLASASLSAAVGEREGAHVLLDRLSETGVRVKAYGNYEDLLRLRVLAERGVNDRALGLARHIITRLDDRAELLMPEQRDVFWERAPFVRALRMFAHRMLS